MIPKGAFLAQVSHEIRNPMNAIIGISTLLLEPEYSPHVRDQAALIRRSTEGLVVLLNDLLDFSKIEPGKMDLDEEPYSLRACIGDVVELMTPLATGKGLHFAASIAANVPDYVLGDAGRVRQIVSNLVSNAIKFTETGSVDIEARVHTPPDGDDSLVVGVRDTGIGIPEHVRERLFTVYTQASARTARTHGGTGLGLAISKQLVELMGGQICVDSRPGQGSSFHFSLPLRVASTPRAQTPPVSVPDDVRSDASLAILIVDDNPINRHITQAMLAALGYEDIDTASDGVAAVEAASRRDYALIFMDIHMPSLDGLEATRRIRDRAESAGRPRIIGLTGSVARAQIDACFAAGMDDYLSKPILREALEAALNRGSGSSDPLKD